MNYDGDNASAEELASKIASRIRALPSRTVEPVRVVRREFSKQLASMPARFVIDVATRLLDQPGVHRFVTYELVKHHRGAATIVRQKELERFGRGIDDWSAVDCFACYLSGPVWRERQVSDKLIHRWARSTDRWWRRAALVSTVPL